MLDLQNDTMVSQKVYLGGSWMATEETMDLINPATGRVFSRVHTVDREQVKAALRAGLRPCQCGAISPQESASVVTPCC